MSTSLYELTYNTDLPRLYFPGLVVLTISPIFHAFLRVFMLNLDQANKELEFSEGYEIVPLTMAIKRKKPHVKNM